MTKLKNILAMATAGAVLGSGLTAAAALDFTTSDNLNYTVSASGLDQVIPDNTPAGVGYSLNFGAGGLSIGDISVTLDIGGGYNGDLYAYLSNGSILVQLLDPNPAVSGSGFNSVTLSETGSSIPTGGSGPLTGSYIAYGNLSAFNNTDPNGNWTIFFADLSPGDTSTLNGFSVDIAAVPEPTTMALAVFAGVAFLAGIVRWQWRKQRCRSV
jgi:subtilisin-like proprotein convertase family protein